MSKWDVESLTSESSSPLTSTVCERIPVAKSKSCKILSERVQL